MMVGLRFVTSASESRITFRDRLTVRLTAAVIGALLLIGTPFLLAFHTLRRDQQLEALTVATEGLSQLVVDSLRSSMLAGMPHLMDDAMQRIAEQEQVERVRLLDHRRHARGASGESTAAGARPQQQDPACAVCHEAGVDVPEGKTVVVSERGRRLLRSTTAIRNEPRCHECHDPADPINGVLLIDYTLGAADRHFFADIGRTVVLGMVMVLVTILVLVWLLRGMVHRPLQAVVAASRRIVEGDLDAQVSVSQPGEFAELASQVNHMTAHLSRSLRTVESHRRELQAILDAIDDEVVVFDAERRVLMTNAAFRNNAVHPQVEPAGSACCEALSRSAACTGEVSESCPVERVFVTGQLQKGLISRTRADGKERVTEIHASPLRGPDGGVHRAVEVRRDISERRQMEAVVAHSERLASLGLLASGLSHEINNPLGAIATTVAGLRRRLVDQTGISREAAAELEQVLARINQEVERCRAITHRLLKVARPAVSARSLADLNHVVEDILAILSHEIKRYGITPRLKLAPLPPLRVDAAQLGQIVMNLTLNAVQAMSENGGELRITTAIDNGEIVMRFEDSGCGIPAPLLKRIFEPFFTTKPVGKGTGLGLFITHRIVSDLGGTIAVRSEPGAQTCFTVRLPRGINEPAS